MGMPHYSNQSEDLGIIPATVPLHGLRQAPDYTLSSVPHSVLLAEVGVSLLCHACASRLGKRG